MSEHQESQAGVQNNHGHKSSSDLGEERKEDHRGGSTQGTGSGFIVVMSAVDCSSYDVVVNTTISLAEYHCLYQR